MQPIRPERIRGRPGALTLRRCHRMLSQVSAASGGMNLAQQVPRTDAAGLPLEWIGYQDAVRLYSLEQVAYTLGQVLFDLHGGVNARSGRRSHIEIHSIIATYG